MKNELFIIIGDKPYCIEKGYIKKIVSKDKHSLYQSYWVICLYSSEILANITPLNFNKVFFIDGLENSIFEYKENSDEMIDLSFVDFYFFDLKPLLNNITISILYYDVFEKKISIVLKGKIRPDEEGFPDFFDFYFEGLVEFKGVYFFDYTEEEIKNILDFSMQELKIEWVNKTDCIVNYK